MKKHVKSLKFTSTCLLSLLGVVILFSYQNCSDVHIKSIDENKGNVCPWVSDKTATVNPVTSGLPRAYRVEHPETRKYISSMIVVDWMGNGKEDLLILSDRSGQSFPSAGLENPMICFDIKNGGPNHDCWEFRYAGNVCEESGHCLGDANQFDLLNAWFTQAIAVKNPASQRNDIVLFPHGQAYSQIPVAKMSWGDGVILINQGRDASTGEPKFDRKTFYNYTYKDPASLSGTVGDFDGDGQPDIAFIERKSRIVTHDTQVTSCDEHPAYYCQSLGASCSSLPTGTTCTDSVGPAYYKSGGAYASGFPASTDVHIIFSAWKQNPRDLAYSLPNSMPKDGKYSRQWMYNSWYDAIADADPRSYDGHLQTLTVSKLPRTFDISSQLFIMNDDGIGYHYILSQLEKFRNGKCPILSKVNRPSPNDRDNIFDLSVAYDRQASVYDLMIAGTNLEIYYNDPSGQFTADTFTTGISNTVFVKEIEMQVGSGRLDLITMRANPGSASNLLVEWRKLIGTSPDRGRVYETPIVVGAIPGSSAPPIIFTDIDADGVLDMIYYNNGFITLPTRGL